MIAIRQALYAGRQVTCFEMQARQQEREHERAIQNMIHLGWVYTEQQRYGEAEALFLDAFEFSYRVSGPMDQVTLESICKIVELYEAWGKPEMAEE